MAHLTGKEALEFLEALERQDAERRGNNLAKAKAAAVERGKEPFELEKLESMCDTSSEGRFDPVEDRRVRFEHMYYVEYPQLMTVAELADFVSRISKW